MKDHGEFIKSHSRGHGYWLWKPYLILKTLREMKDGDVLVYADAGCVLNPSGRQRLHDYVDMARNSSTGILCFELRDQLERQWTKGDVFERAKYTGYDTRQICATASVWYNCHQSRELAEGWLLACADENYHFLDDSPSRTPNQPGFIEHRHDQSIFSILMKQAGSAFLADETYYLDWQNHIDKPIHARRLKY